MKLTIVPSIAIGILCLWSVGNASYARQRRSLMPAYLRQYLINAAHQGLPGYACWSQYKAPTDKHASTEVNKRGLMPSYLRQALLRQEHRRQHLSYNAVKQKTQRVSV